MENEMEHKTQELLAQELENIAGGVQAPSQGEYSTDNLYNSVAESVSKKLNDAVSGYYPGEQAYYKKEETYYATEPGNSSAS